MSEGYENLFKAITDVSQAETGPFGMTYKEAYHQTMAELLRLRRTVELCAQEIYVSVATADSGGIDYQEMYESWREVACRRADIARAALEQNRAET
jgi:demethoxyubiquinone hydroxylase (CLK1/Coq7/Cat5 family)